MLLFETERLLLREILPEDYNDLYSMNSDPAVMRHVGDGSIRTPEQMKEELDNLLSYYFRKPGLGIWATVLKDTYQFIGVSGLVYYADTRDVEIAFRFLKEHWNKGYATEVSAALLKHGFETLGLPRIVSSSHVENLPSIRVMEKIGMRHIDNRAQHGCAHAFYEIERRHYKAANYKR